MANEQIITCGDGITLRTSEDGTALCVGDCEGGPAPCCPSVCGERFEVCITRYLKVARDVLTEEILLPSGEWGLYSRREIRFRHEYLDTPTKLAEWIGQGVCVARGRVLARTTEELIEEAGVDYRSGDCGVYERDPGGITLHTRRIEDECLDRAYGCYDSQGVITDGVYEGFLANGGHPVAGTFPVIAAAVYSTGTFGNYTGETVVHNQFRAGRGPGFFRSTFVSDATAQLPTEICFGDGTPRSRRLRWTREESLEVTWTLSTLVTCDGSPADAPCLGHTPASCDGGLQYIPGVPCIDNEVAPPVVWLAQNVGTCRTMPSGGFCYRVSPNTPRLGDPGGARVDYGVVAQYTGFPDCCACLFCGNTITRYPCWQNFARSPDGTPIITPAFIEDGHCCCDPLDTITIAQMDNTLIGFGQRQEWRLRGAPHSFLRNRVEAVPGNELISDVAVYDENAPDNAPPLFSFPFNHGQFLNDPPMGCQWDQLGTTFFQFATPADGAPAAPIGVNGALPCPDDPNGERGAWRLILWSVSVTCRTFAFQGQWINTGNGLRLMTRTQFNVTPPADAEFRRCGGGCAKRPAGDFTAPGPLRPALPGPMGIGDLRNIIGGGGG